MIFIYIRQWGGERERENLIYRRKIQIIKNRVVRMPEMFVTEM
jgi:hypothetical protein